MDPFEEALAFTALEVELIGQVKPNVTRLEINGRDIPIEADGVYHATVALDAEDTEVEAKLHTDTGKVVTKRIHVDTHTYRKTTG
jgi:hypothetical protein